MFITLQSQTFVFLMSCLGGFLVATLYEILNALRRTAKKKICAGLVLDSVFWLVLTLLFFIFAVTAARGEVRGYWFLGAGFGFLFFRLTLAPIVRSITQRIHHGAKKLIRLVLVVFTRLKQRLFHFFGTDLRKKTNKSRKKAFHLRRNKVK